MTRGSGYRGPGLDRVSLAEAAYILEECRIIFHQVDVILARLKPVDLANLHGPQVKSLGLIMPSLGMAQDAEVVQSLCQVRVFRPQQFFLYFYHLLQQVPGFLEFLEGVREFRRGVQIREVGRLQIARPIGNIASP